MAAKLRPRVMLPRPVSSTAVAWRKPAAVSFSGLLGGEQNEVTELLQAFARLFETRYSASR
jgi:hypothetical protein